MSGPYGSGIAPTTWPSAGRATSPPDVVGLSDVWVLGDSILYQGYSDLIARLPGRAVGINAWNGRPTTPTVDALAEWLALYPAPAVVVIAAGSNDTYDPRPMYSQVHRAMNMLPPTTLVRWVNVFRCSAGQTAARREADLRTSGWVNSQIAHACGEFDNLRLVDWHGHLTAVPTRVVSYLTDGVHTTEAGRNARNALMANAINIPT